MPFPQVSQFLFIEVVRDGLKHLDVLDEEDPLSPFLFNQVVNVLSILMTRA